MKNESIVFIRRMPNKRLPFDVYRESTQEIGSFIDSNTRQAYRCLTPPEERKILPQFVGINSDDSNFNGECMEFYKDISIKVPPPSDAKELWSSGGLKLNVATDDQGMPYAPMDYIMYKHALRAPRVAQSLEEAQTNPSTYDFFIIDLSTEQQNKAKRLNDYNKAMQQYLKHFAVEDVDYEFVNTLLSVLVSYRGLNPVRLEEMSNADKLDELRRLAEAKPAEFYTAITNENLTELNLVNDAINSGIISKVGGMYYYGDESLGRGIDEVITAIKRPTFTNGYLEIQAKLEATK